MPVAGRALSLLALFLSTVLGRADVHATEIRAAEEIRPDTGKLVISGSMSMAPMLRAFSQRFLMLHPGVQIEVRAVGSGQGIVDVSQGKADIGMVSRLLTAKEGGPNIFAVARDGVCLIVHKNNRIQALSNRQVADVFTGRITNWSAVGGKNAPIVVINSSPGAGTVDLFTQFFNVRYSDIRARFMVASTQARVEAISDEPNAIAYMSVGAAQVHAAKGDPIKLLAADGVAATTKNIRSGNFPLARPLLLITRELPTGLQKEFIAFSLSSKTTDLVLQHDFVPYLD